MVTLKDTGTQAAFSEAGTRWTQEAGAIAASLFNRPLASFLNLG